MSVITIGFIADRMIHKWGFTVETTRMIMQVSGMVIPAIFLTVMVYSDISSAMQATTLLSLAFFFNGTCMAGFSVYQHDVLSRYVSLQFFSDLACFILTIVVVLLRYAGTVYSIGNTFGVLAGVLGVAISGEIIDAGSWSLVSRMACLVLFCPVIVYSLTSESSLLMSHYLSSFCAVGVHVHERIVYYRRSILGDFGKRTAQHLLI